ncbi:ATP-binding cassette domain-containing protein [Streptomyces sp. TRM 70361]|uniref:ATP-binding cassette domain-containing protein n=1 Tax=Streptomyces sp. TRM 70361 TaxID=3116553 RepID=UPI002E7B49FE|nr:ATP-binding cassette domain-containing protein [Streptomyces sp. TRM 70361]MEE1940645.1 ATP-binding cassette domain-containing protein [Streptomyces sp. TRM 70361]
MGRRLTGSGRAAARSRRAGPRRIVALLPAAGRGPVAAAVACDVLLGVLPVVLVVSSSVMVGRVPGALVAGTGSARWSGVLTAFAVASAAFTAQQVLAPWQRALGELVARRVDGALFDRLVAASLCGPGIGPLEDPRLLERLSEARRELETGADSPGKACAGLLHLLARWVQLAGCVGVIGFCFSWIAGFAVCAAVLAMRHSLRRGLRGHMSSWSSLVGLRREERYLRDLASRPAAGKEIRVFGLAGWLRDRHRAVALEWMTPAWAERRRLLLWPHLRYTVVGLVITAAVLAAVAAAGAGGATLTGLALATQAVLIGVRLGEFYPESDMQTILGMNAHDALTAFEEGVARHPAQPDAPETPDTPQTPPPAPRREIAFSGVSFRYPGRERRVFECLDLRIEAGKCTAIVGANGAGKTTLIKLLTRLYEPDEGRITVDGTPLGHCPAEVWRSRIAVVFQDFNRYEASALDNVGYGAVHRKDAAGARREIRAAATEAGVADVLEALPGGFGTPLAGHLTGGTELSGGQWQRVALARALFRLRHGAGVLVLDEPTASLDVRAEARFYQEFVRPGVTTVLISHRFATVRHADHIVVLSGGRVSEQGSHGELMRADGEYARLFRLQAYRFTEERPPSALPGAR